MAETKRNFLSEQWQKIPAKWQRYTMIGIASVVGFMILWSFVTSGNSPQSRKRTAREDVSTEVFTGANARNMGLQGLAASMRRLEAASKQRDEQIEVLRKKLDAKDEAGQQTRHLREKQIQDAAIREALRLFEQKYAGKLSNSTPSVPEKQEIPAVLPPLSSVDGPLAPGDVDWQGGGASNQTVAVTQGGQEKARAKTPRMKVIVDEEAVKEQEEALKKLQKKKDQEMSPDLFLPAGSIFSGTLITGVDAPTKTSARNNPFPALLRIKKEAILPNRFRSDVRECFMIVSGYGDLSSERGYFRSETVSCIRGDGGVIEAPIDMYAVGEDGKAGVRGRLRSKQGQFVARSLMAAFMESFASVFTKSPVPTVLTSGSDKTPYQQAFSSDAFQSASVKGVGSAMKRLADFYMEMAENVFPVIEIDAGRQIDFVMTRGTTLKLR